MEIGKDSGVIIAFRNAIFAPEADRTGDERLYKVLTIQCEPVSSPEPLKLKRPA
jgi:hypothetical protein